jgi:hypothetical protein
MLVHRAQRASDEGVAAVIKAAENLLLIRGRVSRRPGPLSELAKQPNTRPVAADGDCADSIS